MNDEKDYEPDCDDHESRIEELERRIEELESEESEKQGRKSDSGCFAFPYSVGAALAVVISWETNHSVLLGLLHGLLSWIYVVYALLTHDSVKLL